MSYTYAYMTFTQVSSCINRFKYMLTDMNFSYIMIYNSNSMISMKFMMGISNSTSCITTETE